MLTCIAFYRGTKLSDLELVALSTDRKLIGKVAKKLLAHQNSAKDAAAALRRKATREALHIIAAETAND
jgi:hypothetical protein